MVASGSMTKVQGGTSMNAIISKKSGIYKIVNNITGKFYIGQTYNLWKRKKDHWYKLLGNRHRNQHLQHAWNKYGEDNFEFVPIVICELKELNYYEQKCVDLLNPYYNIRLECVNNNLGLKHTEETKRKISLGNKGKQFSEETRRKISEYQKSYTHPLSSDETKMKISLSHKGKTFSEEHRRNLSLAVKGTHHSKETREKMSISRKGNGNSFFGKHHSKETKRKRSEDMKKFYAVKKKEDPSFCINKDGSRGFSEILALSENIGTPSKKLGDSEGASEE